jgi:hypothetical protein
MIGAGKRGRTSDLRVTNALLYQLSYSGEENPRILRLCYWFCQGLLRRTGRLADILRLFFNRADTSENNDLEPSLPIGLKQ